MKLDWRRNSLFLQAQTSSSITFCNVKQRAPMRHDDHNVHFNTDGYVYT